MADRVLGFRAHLGRRLLGAVRHEDRVVAEAPGAARNPCQPALDLPGHHPLAGRPAVRGGHDQGGGTDEPGTEASLRHVGHLRQHQVQVGLVVAVQAGPAGGQHAGHAAERVHAQAGIVGHRGQLSVRCDGARLQQRVLLERDPGLGHLGRAGKRVEPGQRDLRAAGALGGQDPGQLAQLGGVPAGENEGVSRHAGLRR
jgi:hypothetical protein